MQSHQQQERDKTFNAKETPKTHIKSPTQTTQTCQPN
jgi:hypothetical protein